MPRRRILYDIGDIVWAKVLGYPWWPAKVVSFNQQNNSYNIAFINHNSHAILHVNKLRAFNENLQELRRQKKVSRQFRRAVQLAEAEAKAMEDQEAQGDGKEEERKKTIQERQQSPNIDESKQARQTQVRQILPIPENSYTQYFPMWSWFYPSYTQPTILLSQPQIQLPSTIPKVPLAFDQPQPPQPIPPTVIRLPEAPIVQVPTNQPANNQTQTKFTAQELRSLKITEDNILQLLEMGVHEDCRTVFEDQKEVEKFRKKLKKVLLEKFGMGKWSRLRTMKRPKRRIKKGKGRSVDPTQNLRWDVIFETRIKSLEMDFINEFINMGVERSSAQAESQGLIDQVRLRPPGQSAEEIFRRLDQALALLKVDVLSYNNCYGSFLSPDFMVDKGNGDEVGRGQNNTVTENSSNVKKQS